MPTARRWLVLLPLLTALVPPLAVIALVAGHTVNVPYKDQWGHVPFIVEAAKGVIVPGRLWEQVNEHRIPAARVVQALLAWATRWDVRWEAWADVALALGGFALLVDLIRRTIDAPLAAGVAVLLVSALQFSLGQGDDWTWGGMLPAYLAAFAAAGLAWSTARFDGSWEHASAIAGWALLGALSFGSGLGLLAITPLVLLVTPTRASRTLRIQQLAFGAVVGAATLAVYLVDWHPGDDAPAAVFHPDRLATYGGYLLAYLGRASGTDAYPTAQRWGALGVALWLVAGGWLWRVAPERRRAVVAWGVLALYPIGAGMLTAYGRLDVSLGTAGLARYLPTATFFLVSVVGVVALAVAELAVRAPTAARVAAGTALLLVAADAATFAAFARDGWGRALALERQLVAGASCLPDCPDVPDACLLQVCWNANLARFMCTALRNKHLGPWAH